MVRPPRALPMTLSGVRGVFVPGWISGEFGVLLEPKLTEVAAKHPVAAEVLDALSLMLKASPLAASDSGSSEVPTVADGRELDDDVVTTAEAAQILGTTSRNVLDHRDNGRLDVVDRVGQTHRFRRSQVVALHERLEQRRAS